MLPSENIVLQSALKAFRGNRPAPAGYRVLFDDGVFVKKWHDEQGLNPHPVKEFEQPAYNVLDAADEPLFSVVAGYDESNRLRYSVLYESWGEDVTSWDEAMIKGFRQTVLAGFDENKKVSLADLVETLNPKSQQPALKGG